MRHVWVLIALAAVAAAGCRKKSAPEYYRLESQVEVLVARSGDEAWSSDAMEQVRAQLQAIPADATEGPRAAALADRIARERSRLAAEAAAAEAERNRPSTPPAFAEPGAATQGAAAVAGTPETAAADAGPLRPTAGMALKAFLTAFGDCMDQRPAQELPGLGKAQVYAVKGSTGCQERFQVPNDRSAKLYLFIEDRLAGEQTETRTTTVIQVDAGTVAPPAVPAPQTLQFVPGMPQPGYQAPDAQ